MALTFGKGVTRRSVFKYILESLILTFDYSGLSLYKPDNSRETLLLGRCVGVVRRPVCLLNLRYQDFPCAIGSFLNIFSGQRVKNEVQNKLAAVYSNLETLAEAEESVWYSAFLCYYYADFRIVQKLLAPCSDSGAPIPNRSIRRYASRAPGSPVSTEDLELAWKLTPPSPTIFYINIESDEASSSTDSDYINSVDATIGLSPEPRPIKSIKPCLAFVAPFDSSMNARSLFVVSRGEVVYYDQASLMPARHGSHEGGTLYTCDLVPNYWNMICDSSSKSLQFLPISHMFLSPWQTPPNSPYSTMSSETRPILLPPYFLRFTNSATSQTKCILRSLPSLTWIPVSAPSRR